MKVGDQVIVTKTHRNRWNEKLEQNLHGVVSEVSEPGAAYESYSVRWGVAPFVRVPRHGGKTTWVWTRHDDDKYIALRRRSRS